MLLLIYIYIYYTRMHVHTCAHKHANMQTCIHARASFKGMHIQRCSQANCTKIHLFKFSPITSASINTVHSQECFVLYDHIVTYVIDKEFNESIKEHLWIRWPFIYTFKLLIPSYIYIIFSFASPLPPFYHSHIQLVNMQSYINGVWKEFVW